MTRENAKDWLYSVREINRIKRAKVHEMENILIEIENIRDINTRTIDMSQVRSKSDISDPTANTAIKIVTRYSDKLDDLQEILIQLEDDISKVKVRFNEIYESTNMSANEYNILSYYYFEGMSNDEISTAVMYSLACVKKLKSSGVNKVVEYWNQM